MVNQEKGKLDMLHYVVLLVFDWQSFSLEVTPLLQPHLPTQLFCVAFFVSSWRVHLDLQTLYVPFLFHWLFPLISYLALPLFLPRPQIKQLGTLVSLPNY